MSSFSPPRPTPPVRPATGARRLATAAALGAVLNAGVFVSWSLMVVPGVRALPTDQAVTTMQELNAAAPAPYTLVALPAAALCVAAVAATPGRFTTARGRWLLGGAVGFLVAAVVVTAVANVPISARIDRLDPTGADRGEWLDLLTAWTWWNHLRGLGSAAAAVAFALAALRPGRGGDLG